MPSDINLAGFRLTHTEWRELDDEARRHYLAALVETSRRGGVNEAYESYELVIQRQPPAVALPH